MLIIRNLNLISVQSWTSQNCVELQPPNATAEFIRICADQKMARLAQKAITLSTE